MATFSKSQVIEQGSLEKFAHWAECYRVYQLPNGRNFIAIRSERDEQAMFGSQSGRNAKLVWEKGKTIPFDWDDLLNEDVSETKPKTLEIETITKKCPYCSKEIHVDDIACKHCGRTVMSTKLMETNDLRTTKHETVQKKLPIEINKREHFLDNLVEFFVWVKKAFLIGIIGVTIFLVLLAIVAILLSGKKLNIGALAVFITLTLAGVGIAIKELRKLTGTEKQSEENYYNLSAIKSERQKIELQATQIVDNLTPLMIACRDNQLIAAENLLESGVNPNEKLSTGDHWTALMFAIRGNHLDIVTLLVEMGVNLEESDVYGNTPLMKACLGKEYLEICKFLISFGVEVNARNHAGVTSLMVAAQWGCLETVRLLLKSGAEIKARDNSKMTAEMYASKFEYFPVVDLIRNFVN